MATIHTAWHDGLELLIRFFPMEWVRAALTLNLMSVWALIGVFVYLNRQNRKERFSLWTVSWLFYSVYLAASIGLMDAPDALWLVMCCRGCLGISALFMLWGSLQLTHRPRSHRELAGGTLLILVWSYLAAYQVHHSRWLTVPVFLCLAVASGYTGSAYLLGRSASRSAALLGIGFWLWGVHLFLIPFLDLSAGLLTLAHLSSAMLVLVIALGMVIEQEQSISAQDYRVLFDSAGDAVLLVDCATLQILDANRAAQELVGRDSAILTGGCVLDLFPDLRERLPGAWDAERMAAETNRNSELTSLRPDGRRVTCEVHASIVRCPRGRVLLMFARDISALKKTKEDLSLKSAALEADANGIAISDHKGLILWVNPAFARLTGYSAEEAIGQNTWFLKSDGHDHAFYKELRDAVIYGRTWQGQFANCRRDGSEYTEQLTIIPIRNAHGAVTNFVAFKQDVTNQTGPS